MIWNPSDHWLISDLHLGHNNLRKYEGKFRSNRACMNMPFEDYIARNWDAVVQPNQTVWVLGDVVWRVKGFETWLRDRPGTKYLVRGNHDSSRTNAWFKRWGFSEVYRLWYMMRVMDKDAWISEGQFVERDRLLLTHYPIVGGGTRYPERIRDCREAFWRERARLNVHGHTHSHSVDDDKVFNVSCEAIGMGPMNLEKILARTTED